MKLEILLPRMTINESGRVITTCMPSSSYKPVTSLSLVQRMGTVEEVNPYENGTSGPSSRYYHEHWPDYYDAPDETGICFHLKNGGMQFELSEGFTMEEHFLHLVGLDFDGSQEQREAYANVLGRLTREVHKEPLTWHDSDAHFRRIDQTKFNGAYQRVIFRGKDETMP